MAPLTTDALNDPDIGDFVSSATVRRTLAVCGLSILAEGYDIGVMGAAILGLKAETAWNLGTVELGLLSSCALFGMLVGALVIGTLGDAYSRKKLLITCVGIFSIAMIGCALAPTPVVFGLFRAIGGLGMGGIVPIAAALTVEYSPSRTRSRNYGIMYSGYSLGIMLAALVAIPVLPMFGWRALFWIGATPLLFLPLIYRFLPESFGNLVGRGRVEEARALTENLGVSSNDAAMIHEAIARRAALREGAVTNSVRALFIPRHLLATLCFWLSLSIGLLLVYGLNSWLPSIMRQQGYALGSSLGFLAVFSLCSAAGGVLCGVLADRFGVKRVIALSFLTAAVSVLSLGFVNNLIINYILVGVAGYGTVSTALILTAYATAWYPSPIRATAIGWALGVGRIGAICGPIMTGALMAAAGGGVMTSLIAFAALAILAALVVCVIPQRKNAPAAAQPA